MKKAISLVLALALCISLCACGSGSQTKETEAPRNTIPVQTDPAYDNKNLDAILAYMDTVTEAAKDAIEGEAVTEPVETKPVETEPTTQPPETEAATQPTEKAETPATGIRPDFKEAMDAYEEFYTEYCEFLTKYSENPTDFTLIVKYGELVLKAEQMDAAFEKWESEDLTDEELKYYLDVQNRVMKMLVDVM